jgi:hypothetical protein
MSDSASFIIANVGDLRRTLLVLLTVPALVPIAACMRTLEASAIQPNPLWSRRLASDEASSEPLYIHQRDLQLPRNVQLRSSASFAAVSRDRVRFHVGIVHPWEEIADTAGWTVWLEDESGHRRLPQRREVPRVNRVALEWLFDPVLGKVRAYPTIDVYQGKADYVFVERDLLGSRRKALTLVLERDGVQLRYAWSFSRDRFRVSHYLRVRPGLAMQTVIVPGPDTRVAPTTYEDARW